MIMGILEADLPCLFQTVAEAAAVKGTLTIVLVVDEVQYLNKPPPAARPP